MPTDHEQPCGPRHRSFCLNGGICYVIPTIPSPFCRCIENYTGARCEEVFLPSSSIQSKSNLSAAFLALAVLVTLAIVALCFLCRPQRALKTSPVKGIITYKGRLWTTQEKPHSDDFFIFRSNTTRRTRAVKYTNG
ncbi:pro-neuregulin-4, membrane-bound isoform isoform X2 [Rattus norvegicus]|uniref:Neuregulin 4 n=1 Tax=Rattus norvegicus TaxID=10116 RepID=A0ABK0LE13_RAT